MRQEPLRRPGHAIAESRGARQIGSRRRSSRPTVNNAKGKDGGSHTAARAMWRRFWGAWICQSPRPHQEKTIRQTSPSLSSPGTGTTRCTSSPTTTSPARLARSIVGVGETGGALKLARNPNRATNAGQTGAALPGGLDESGEVAQLGIQGRARRAGGSEGQGLKRRSPADGRTAARRASSTRAP